MQQPLLLPGLGGHGSHYAEGVAPFPQDADNLWHSLDGFLVAAGAVHEDDDAVHGGLAGDVVDEILSGGIAGGGVGGADSCR